MGSTAQLEAILQKSCILWRAKCQYFQTQFFLVQQAVRDLQQKESMCELTRPVFVIVVYMDLNEENLQM